MANTGLAMGSLIEGITIPKLGLKKTIIIRNILGLFSNFLKKILLTKTIISGKLFLELLVEFKYFVKLKLLMVLFLQKLCIFMGD